MDRVGREIRDAAAGPPEEYARVLQQAIAACDADPAAAEHRSVLELHSELAEAYDRLGRVEDALRHADVLVERDYRSDPDPRYRRAEILTRHGRLEEAAAIWEEVAHDTPDDVWVYNNAGLEYGAIGEHELARVADAGPRAGDPHRRPRAAGGTAAGLATGEPGRPRAADGPAADRRAMVGGAPTGGSPVVRGGAGTRGPRSGPAAAGRVSVVTRRRVHAPGRPLARHRRRSGRS